MIEPPPISIMEKDAGGNGYSPLFGCNEANYFADSTWSGEIDHPDEPREGGERVVVLCPVN